MSDDEGGDVPVGEHEVDDSLLKLPGVKLEFVKVSTMEEDEDVVYKQYVLLCQAPLCCSPVPLCVAAPPHCMIL